MEELYKEFNLLIMMLSIESIKMEKLTYEKNNYLFNLLVITIWLFEE